MNVSMIVYFFIELDKKQKFRIDNWHFYVFLKSIHNGQFFFLGIFLESTLPSGSHLPAVGMILH